MSNKITTLAAVTTLALLPAIGTESHAAPVWQEIGGSATLTATAENISPVTNLRELFGQGWEVFTKNPESATYAWASQQHIAYLMVGGNPRTEGHLDDLVIEYSVNNDGTWITVPDAYDVTYGGTIEHQSVYLPVDVSAKAVRVTLDKPTNTTNFENMGLYGLNVYGSSTPPAGPMNTATDILANATLSMNGDWEIDNVDITASSAQVRWDDDKAPGGNTARGQGLNADLVTTPTADATFTWSTDQVLAGMEIANMKNGFNANGMIDRLNIEVLDEGIDPTATNLADPTNWTTQFVYDAATQPSISVLIDALFDDGTLVTRGVRMNIESAFVETATGRIDAHIEEIAFVGGVASVIPEPASVMLVGLGGVLLLGRRRVRA
jgi:hypothetical protein